jgi:hypothetical protein
MNDTEMGKLLEQGLSGDPPRPEFREQVLQDSLATFARRRRHRVIWRTTALSAAAVLIAGVSFLLGRASLARQVPSGAAAPTFVAAEGQTVGVPNELVAWLEAARLFGQLGMEDRMARAVDRASRFLPVGSVAAYGGTEPVFAVGGEASPKERKQGGPHRIPALPPSFESVNRIMAQSLGD